MLFIYNIYDQIAFILTALYSLYSLYMIENRNIYKYCHLLIINFKFNFSLTINLTWEVYKKNNVLLSIKHVL